LRRELAIEDRNIGSLHCEAPRQLQADSAAAAADKDASRGC